MSLRALLSLGAVLVTTLPGAPSHSQPTGSRPAATIAAVPNGRVPLVWQVGPSDRPSYLFGTMHAGIPLEAALPASFSACVESSRIVIAEADPGDLGSGGVESLAMFSETGGLDEKMPPSTWQALARDLREAIPPQLLPNVRPWMVLSLLTQKRIGELGRSNGSVAMDVALIGVARTKGLELRFLETAAEQIALMNGLPEASQIRFLRDMVENPEVSNRMIREMLEAYEAADADRMTRVVFRPDYMREFPEFFSRVYSDRNRRWRPILSAEIQRGRAFIAVGLAHLLGGEGLLETLRRDGMPVARVNATHQCAAPPTPR